MKHRRARVTYLDHVDFPCEVSGMFHPHLPGNEVFYALHRQIVNSGTPADSIRDACLHDWPHIFNREAGVFEDWTPEELHSPDVDMWENAGKN